MSRGACWLKSSAPAGADLMFVWRKATGDQRLPAATSLMVFAGRWRSGHRPRAAGSGCSEPVLGRPSGTPRWSPPAGLWVGVLGWRAWRRPRRASRVCHDEVAASTRHSAHRSERIVDPWSTPSKAAHPGGCGRTSPAGPTGLRCTAGSGPRPTSPDHAVARHCPQSRTTSPTRNDQTRQGFLPALKDRVSTPDHRSANSSSGTFLT
jgi:hypothetical protein